MFHEIISTCLLLSYRNMKVFSLYQKLCSLIVVAYL